MHLNGVGLDKLGRVFQHVGGNVLQRFPLLQPQVDVRRRQLVHVEPEKNAVLNKTFLRETGIFSTQSKLIEPVLPQAAQLGVLFIISQRTV